VGLQGRATLSLLGTYAFFLSAHALFRTHILRVGRAEKSAQENRMLLSQGATFWLLMLPIHKAVWYAVRWAYCPPHKHIRNVFLGSLNTTTTVWTWLHLHQTPCLHWNKVFERYWAAIFSSDLERWTGKKRQLRFDLRKKATKFGSLWKSFQKDRQGISLAAQVVFSHLNSLLGSSCCALPIFLKTFSFATKV